MRIPPKDHGRQVTLAKIFGVSQKGARKWLEGEGFPTTETAIKIATWAGVQFEWLMTGRMPKRSSDQDPLIARYAAADPATRALIDLALNQPSAAIPEGLTDSLRALVISARDYIAKQIDRE